MEQLGDLLEDVLPATDTNVPQADTDAEAPAATTNAYVDTPADTQAPKKKKRGTTAKLKKSKKSVKHQPKTVDEWIEARIKDPKQFTMTSEGNFHVPVLGSGTTEQVIDCPQYYQASSDSIRAYSVTRQTKIEEAKTQYAEARRFLYKTYKEYKAGVASISDILTANKQVAEAEQYLISTAYAQRTTYNAVPTPLLRDFLSEAYSVSAIGEKKSPYNVIQVDRTLYPWSIFLVATPPEAIVPGNEQESEESPEAEALPPPPPPSQTDEAAKKARTGAIIGSRKLIRKGAY